MGEVNLWERPLKDGRVTLYLDFRQGGKRYREKLNLFIEQAKGNPLVRQQIAEQNRSVRLLAEQIRSKRTLELSGQEYDLPLSHKRRASFADYFAKVAGGKPNPHTRAVWLQALHHFQQFTGGRVKFSDMTTAHLKGFQDYLVEFVSRNTANLYFVKLKAAFTQAVKDGIIPKNPCVQLENFGHKRREKVKYLTVAELRILASTPCQSAYDTTRAFLFCCYVGLRYSDASALTWGQIREGSIEYRQQKTGTPEMIPLSATARRLLGERGSAPVGGKVFRLAPSSSHNNSILIRWGKRAGLSTHVTFHVARHTFAVTALNNGVSIYEVSRLLGHKSVGTTEQAYADLLEANKRDAVNKLPDFLID